MPFTPAHVAAVLPLRGRMHLPLAALAAGSMSPDLPYFVTPLASLPRLATHGAWGVLTWDLLFGVAMWMLWRWAAPTLRDLAPSTIRNRWQLPGRAPKWWIVALAVVIGSATHVVWDSFTHAGYLETVIAPLAAIYPGPLGPLAGYRYVQYASGVIGLALVIWVGFRRPSMQSSPRRLPGLAAVTPALIFAGALVSVGLRVTTQGISDRRALAFMTVTSSISGAGLVLLLVCAAHGLISRQRGPGIP